MNTFFKLILLCLATLQISCAKHSQKRDNGFYVTNRTSQDIKFAIQSDSGTTSQVTAPANTERLFVNVYSDSYEITSCGSLRGQEPCSNDAQQNRIYVKATNTQELPYVVCVLEQQGGFNSLYEFYEQGSSCPADRTRY